jgi:hypothetical protein
MLRSAKKILGYRVSAVNGPIGAVHDFLFDDQQWVLRYLVVKMGRGKAIRNVLLPPGVLQKPEWRTKEFGVSLTTGQVAASPDLDTDAPVSRQYERALHAHYDWAPYWGGPLIPVAETRSTTDRALSSTAKQPQARRWQPYWGGPLIPTDETGDEAGSDERRGKGRKDVHLRSVRAKLGYTVLAIDGDIGRVSDFIIDEDGWIVRYMIVRTRFVLRKEVLIAPQWVQRIAWSAQSTYVGLTREEVRHSPRFDPSAPINRRYETRLFDYYGRPVYWE